MADTFNKFLISSNGTTLHIGVLARGGLTPDEALILAAWLEAMAEPIANTKFAELLAEIQES